MGGTYKQIQKKGDQVRKGEKASLIVFYKGLECAREEPQEGPDETRSVWMARGLCAAGKCGSRWGASRLRLFLAQGRRVGGTRVPGPKGGHSGSPAVCVSLARWPKPA